MDIVYIDRLSIFSLTALIASRIDYSHIFYFNTSSNAAKLVKLFIKLKLLKTRPQLAEFTVGDIRDESGESQFMRINKEINDIVFDISNYELNNSSFLKELGKHFDFRKILLFFERILATELHDIVIFINTAKWHSEYKVCSKNKPVFFLEKGMWSCYLSKYAARLSVNTVEYKSLINSIYLTYYFAHLKLQTLSIIKSKLKTFKLSNYPKIKNTPKQSKIIDKIPPVIGASYTCKTVTFDLKKRSEFFWLLKAKVPYDNVLVYFDREDIPASQKTADILGKKRVKALALSNKARTSNDIPVSSSGSTYKEKMKYFFKLIAKNILLNVVKLDMPPLFYIANMLYFVKQYSYWYDFFLTNNIKINISPNDSTKLYRPKNLALERCGGISISYQWSNLDLPFVAKQNNSDVLFSFGPAYRWIWEKNRSSINNLIYCGYITDYSFKEVRNDSLNLKSRLIEKGVKFIICYFDENSLDNRMSAISNKKSAEIYEYFIRNMLEDETLGLIFKPGYPKTLYSRISPISSLIEKAKASGRCIFMDKGSYVTEQYPAEAAQAADLCVGLLLSGTVALESYLSGTSTVFLDIEKLYSNPIYKWGKGKVVFDSLDSLFSALNKYRGDPDSIPGFGDLSLWVKDRDPFKDGNASLRIGRYIEWLYEKFEEGKTRGEAMEYANQNYEKMWGTENVVKCH